MIDNIIAYVLSAILFVLSLILYVFCTSCLIPRIFIRPSYSSNNVCDRGVKKYLFEDGRAIVYEPKQDVRQYINQYILSECNGKRGLQCKLDESIKKISYRILTFDAYDNALGAFEVTERGIKDEITQSVDLPYDTVYVSIEVKSINGKKIVSESDINYSATRLLAFVGITVILTVVEAFITKAFVSKTFSTFFGFSENTFLGFFSTVSVSMIVGTVLSVFIFLSRYSKEYKIKK